jgi:hypothetical protein
MNQKMNNQPLSPPKNRAWWLQLTAPPGTDQYALAPNRVERDRLRKAGLISGIAPFVFFAPLLLSAQIKSPAASFAIIICIIAAIVALCFNRAGWQKTAALCLILALDAAIENALLHAPGGLGLVWLSTFDLFILPLFLAGMLLSQRIIWLFLALHIALILGDIFFLPHTAQMTSYMHDWGATVVFAQPLILEIGMCLLCFFQVRSTDQAVTRADRAEELANLEHQIAQEKQQLEADIQKLSEALSYAANGRSIVQTNIETGKTLWPLALQVTTLLTRLKNSRQSDTALRQAETDVAMLAEVIRAMRLGRRAVWPTPNGGIVDGLILELRNTISPKMPPSHEAEKQ